MSKKKRREFSWDFKKRIIEEYYSGKITAAQLASEHNLATETIYKWKYELELKRKKDREVELKNEGRSPEDIRRIAQLEEELREYKLMLAEKDLQVELLKKLQPSSQQTKNVNGLEKIRKELGLSKGRVK